jgi:hypothetical protein
MTARATFESRPLSCRHSWSVARLLPFSNVSALVVYGSPMFFEWADISSRVAVYASNEHTSEPGWSALRSALALYVPASSFHRTNFHNDRSMPRCLTFCFSLHGNAKVFDLARDVSGPTWWGKSCPCHPRRPPESEMEALTGYWRTFLVLNACPSEETQAL